MKWLSSVKSLSGIASRLFWLGLLAVIIKTGMLVLAWQLPKKGVDEIPFQPENLYTSYKPSKGFKLMRPTVRKTPPRPKGPVYKLDRLKLKGIYAGASAFIAVEENKKVLLIGIDETHNGYRLTEVHDDHAVFMSKGKRYELRFDEDKKKGKSTITQAPREKIAPPVRSVINEGDAVFIERNEIRHYAKNFDDIWKSVKIQEIIKNKRLEGFRVNWVKEKSVFEKIGLQKGDIIVGANDRRFKSLSEVFRLYNNVDNIDSLKLTILRDNQEMELEYEIF